MSHEIKVDEDIQYNSITRYLFGEFITVSNFEQKRKVKNHCYEEHCILPVFHNTFHLSKIIYQDEFGFKWRVMWFKDKYGGYICDESGFHKTWNDLIHNVNYINDWVEKNLLLDGHICKMIKICFHCLVEYKNCECEKNSSKTLQPITKMYCINDSCDN